MLWDVQRNKSKRRGFIGTGFKRCYHYLIFTFDIFKLGPSLVPNLLYFQFSVHFHNFRPNSMTGIRYTNQLKFRLKYVGRWCSWDCNPGWYLIYHLRKKRFSRNKVLKCWPLCIPLSWAGRLPYGRFLSSKFVKRSSRENEPLPQKPLLSATSHIWTTAMTAKWL